ncbi:MAG: Hsp20/alpha crystallin family protein [Bacteriovoracaceae bacterium]|nr:Hsp20/alpha crystallin family protein [Bacteriovoracaceae bacterium]
MKRMYVVLGIMFLFVFWAGALLGQQSSRPVDDKESASMEKRLKMREEMHRRMMEKLLKGTGPDEDMFKDMEQFLDEVMTDSFSGFDSFTRTTAQNYKMEWSETSEGRVLTITPQSPEQKLDIDISNGLVIIKGKTENKSGNSVSISNFSNSFNVPGDCDPSKVKIDQKDGKILVQFPFWDSKAISDKQKNDRKPIPPSDSDVQI